MNEKMKKNRRQFFSTVLAAPVSTALAPAMASNKGDRFIPPGFKPGQIKLASVSWNFGGIINSYPYDETIDIIGVMGFAGIELIIGESKDIEDYWNKESTISHLKKKLDSYEMSVSQFVLFQNAAADLSNLNTSARNRSLDVFEEGCKIAQKLNAPIINIVAPWPREVTGPSAYLPRYFAERSQGKKYHMDIAAGFDFAEVWETFAHTMKDCTERAAHHGLRFSLENHTHTLVHDATAFLHLWDHVKDPNLGMNLDIGWIQLQREYPPLAIYKVKDHLINCHLRDIDSEGLVFVGIGEGVMDLKAVILALQSIGFTGYLAFEQDGVPDMRATIRKGKRMIEELLRLTP
ncbi:MAG: sugar phosphate isomerase/epimerase [Candidatus Omnitrophica bacterium]|nr:sugar phosphate isomerase/epimerase [Candidatus Omnitrophota bacterium]